LFTFKISLLVSALNDWYPAVIFLNPKVESKRSKGKNSPKGTKLFLLFYDEADANIHGRLYEYNLSTPYDVSTLSLVTSAGIELGDTATEVDNPAAVRFSPNGKRLFIVSHDDSDASDRGVTQITLSIPFDTSSFVVDGKLVVFDTMSYNNSQPRGIAFNSSGLKLYLTKDRSTNPDAGDDQIIEHDLKCPYNLIVGKCLSITENSDRTGMALAQIEIAKRTIDHSTDTALNRLKWIRRNKDKQNLTNLNINFNFTNQRLASLTEVVKASAAKKKTKDKDEDVFYWSEGSIAIGRIGDTSISSTKKIDTDAITIGADKSTDNGRMFGVALRFGNDDIDFGNVLLKIYIAGSRIGAVEIAVQNGINNEESKKGLLKGYAEANFGKIDMESELWNGYKIWDIGSKQIYYYAYERDNRPTDEGIVVTSKSYFDVLLHDNYE